MLSTSVCLIERKMNFRLSFSVWKSVRNRNFQTPLVRNGFIPGLCRSLCSTSDEEDNVMQNFKDGYKETGADLPEDENDTLSTRGEEVISETEFLSDEIGIEMLDRFEAKTGDKRKRPKIDPSSTSILMFPGQGCQFVGMGKKLLRYPGVKEIYDRASGILGYDLLDLCLNGPDSTLQKTEYCQPAIVVTSLAAVEKLREEKPEAVDLCVSALGFSVGEITALMFAEKLSFEDGINLVKTRAKYMQIDSEKVSSGMMTVTCNHKTRLKYSLLAAREYCQNRLKMDDPVCKIASYLGTEMRVVAGHTEALDFVQQTRKDFGICSIKRLNVSGAFHTKLMDGAKEEVRKLLENINIGRGKVQVYSNLTHKVYPGKEKNAKTLLSNQITETVKWEHILHRAYTRPQEDTHPYTYEVGPKRSLGYLLRSTNAKAFARYNTVNV